MMKEMKKKVFAILLAFAMVFTLMPLAAFAENTGGSGDSIEGDGPMPEIDPTPGVTFTVFKFEWVDDEMCPLEGAVFTLTDIADSSKVYGQTSDAKEMQHSTIFRTEPMNYRKLRHRKDIGAIHCL